MSVLTGIKLKSFRAFDSLELAGLGGVNLIVGQNDAGKTCLLEGLVTLLDPTMLQTLPVLFRANEGNPTERFYPWMIRAGCLEATIEALADPSWSVNLRTGEARPLQEDEWRIVFKDPSADLYVSSNCAKKPGGEAALRVRAVSAHSLSPEDLAYAFGEAVRTADGEKTIESLLRSVDGRVQAIRLAFTDRPSIAVDLGLPERLPLSQVGQGVYRLVGIFSELLGPRPPNVCLIDEIENGIHHTALRQVWTGIAEAAGRLRIQVFATTHSAECLTAAHEAFAGRKAYDLRVVQLFRIDNQTTGRVLDRRLIEAAIAGEIDLR